jgi:hypothetical protein
MQLLSLDELKLLKDAGFIDDGDDSEFEMVASALEQLRTNIKWLPAALIRLLAELPERFDMDDIESAVQAHGLTQLASFHIQQSNIERESAEFKRGKYGDWRSLGISNDEMYEIVSGYYESSDSMKREVASFYKDGADNRLFMDFKNMLQGSMSARDLLELIRDGLTADDIVGLKDAGLRISKESVAEWSSVESKVILFCIDHGISRDDRGEIFADWMPSGDVVLPWWDYCTKKGWLSKYTKSELLQGISFYDATDDQLTETLDGPHIVELLSLWDYLAWISYSGIKGKFKEIEDWRMRGFMARHQSTPPEFEDLDFSSRSDALAWRYFKFSPKQATDWSRVRLMERLMPGLSPKEAAQWRDAGVKPDEVKAWFDHSISNPSEAASWIATGATPQIAQNRKRAGVNPRAIQD